jgi:serine/threonine-protein kinase RIO1
LRIKTDDIPIGRFKSKRSVRKKNSREAYEKAVRHLEDVKVFEDTIDPDVLRYCLKEQNRRNIRKCGGSPKGKKREAKAFKHQWNDVTVSPTAHKSRTRKTNPYTVDIYRSAAGHFPDYDRS